MELRGLAAERRDADRVLEQTSRVAVMPVRAGGRKERAGPSRISGSRDERVDDCGKPGVGDLGREELEEAVELVGVSAQRGRERSAGSASSAGSTARTCTWSLPPKRSTRPSTCTASPSSKRRSSRSTSFQTRASTRPLASASSRARYGGARTRATSLLLGRPRTRPRRSGPRRARRSSSCPESMARGVGTLAAMADVTPFRAVRYSGAAGSLADLVAPPYDAVDDARASAAASRASPYNVVHVTLPESADEAAAASTGTWLADGILGATTTPGRRGSWSRTTSVRTASRASAAGSSPRWRAEPYATGSRPPARAHAPAIREERLRLLRATRVAAGADLPPRRRATRPRRVPSGPGDLEVDGTRLWRLAALDVPELSRTSSSSSPTATIGTRARSTSAPSSVAGARIMALVVSTDDPGLARLPDAPRLLATGPIVERAGTASRVADLDEALARARATSPSRARRPSSYRTGRASSSSAGWRASSTSSSSTGTASTGSRTRRVATRRWRRVDSGDADVAFLLRAPRVDDVFDGRAPR